MVNEEIRIGIIGAGTNTCAQHIPKLQALPGVSIVEVANRTVASGEKVAAQFNIPVVQEHWQDICRSPDTSAVVIGTWPYLHSEATCLALENNKHVLCEARMAMDEEEARKMLQASYDHPECITQLVPSPFTLRVDPTVIRMLDEKAFGNHLLHFRFDHHVPPLVPQGGTLHWRRNRKYSGNNIMVLGIAYESLLRWLGPAEWVAAHAEIFNNRAHDPELNQDAAIDIPDYLSVQMKMRNGMSGHLHLTETGFSGAPPTLKLFGDRGSLVYEFKADGRLYFDSGSKNLVEEHSIPPEEEGGWRVEEEFVNAIRGQEDIDYTTFTAGVEYMKFTDAVNKSFLTQGTRITIPSG